MPSAQPSRFDRDLLLTTERVDHMLVGLANALRKNYTAASKQTPPSFDPVETALALSEFVDATSKVWGIFNKRHAADPSELVGVFKPTAEQIKQFHLDAPDLGLSQALAGPTQGFLNWLVFAVSLDMRQRSSLVVAGLYRKVGGKPSKFAEQAAKDIPFFLYRITNRIKLLGKPIPAPGTVVIEKPKAKVPPRVTTPKPADLEERQQARLFPDPRKKGPDFIY